MFSPRDIGARVAVRRTVPSGEHSDVIGTLISWHDGILSVQRGEGDEVSIEESAVVAGRVVPTPPPPRRPGVPHVSIEDMQRMANAGWPARDTERLGEWLLRAHGGITGRANSVMAVGDPGTDLDEALRRIERWYAERALPPLLQLPTQDDRNDALEQRGWRQLHVTLVQAAAVEATLAQLPERPNLQALVQSRPDDTWLSLMHDLDRDDPDSHVAILTGPQVVAFVTLLDREEPVGIGRVSIEGRWAGVTSVDVAPHRRREGIGSAVMRSLLEWAATQGARAAYLQVRALNEPAVALYQRLGFLTHHPYCYRAPDR